MIGPTFSPLAGVDDALDQAQGDLALGESVSTALTDAATRADRAIATYNANPAAWDACDGLTAAECAR